MPDEIRIGGGGSVTIDYSDKYKDNSSGGGRKKVKDNDATLSKVVVKGQEIELGPNDTVVIVTTP